MKPHQRRQAGAYPYFKIATWDSVSMTFVDGRETYPSAEAALGSVEGKPGRYRISAVFGDSRGRDDLAPFTITH